MKRQTRLNLFRSAALAAAIAVGGSAHADAISSFGDIDCFGTGFVCADGFFGAGDSAAFTTFTGAMTADATSPVTDSFVLSNAQSWTHTLALAGGESLATLAFRTYGMSDQRGPYDIFVNGTLVGTTALIDTGAAATSQQIVTSSFDFSAAVLTSGINTITMTKLGGGGDSWALDYAQLSATSASIPEPGTLALLGLSLAGLAASRRRKQ